MDSIDINKVISEMTLEEKALLLSGETFFRTRKLDKYGIPHMQLLDGGTGLNFEQLFGDWFRDDILANPEFKYEQFERVILNFFEKEKLLPEDMPVYDFVLDGMKKKLGTEDIMPLGCYPPGILLGSTWNKDVIRNVGDALGMEARKYGIDCLLGTPNVNLLREPRNGRFFEGYSEDPYLAGELGSQMVAGVEGRGVASDVKHFAANNLEINRIGIDQHISQRTLEEMYLPGFQKCLKAGAATVMTSYPSINGQHCTEHPWLLRDVLRERWGYEGLNMTDWGACTGKTGDSVEAGIDLMMPGPWPHEDIVEAVNEGRLSMKNLDEAVTRMLEFINKYSYEINAVSDVDNKSFLEIGDKANYEAVAQGAVLLKNNGSLPLSQDAVPVLYGNSTLRIYGDGSAQVYTSRYGDFTKTIPGLLVEDDAAFMCENAVALVVCSMGSGEGKDRVDLKLDAETIMRLRHLRDLRESGAKGKIFLLLNVPGPVELGEFIDDIDAALSIYYPGGMGVQVVTDIMYGKVNPSGHLTCTWPVRYEDTPAFLCYPDGYHCNYGEGIFVGYRGYQKRKLAPMFPFGWGLSYTTFKLSDINIDSHQCVEGDKINVAYKVTNTGKMDGYAVVQLYISDKVSKVNKPVRELKGFEKMYIPAGETVTSSITINYSDLASYDDDLMKWIVEDGEYEIALGFNCDDMEVSEVIRVMDGAPEYRLGVHMTFDELGKYPQLREVLIKDIIDNGDVPVFVTVNERYTPANRINSVYPNADKYSNFIKACNDYLKE
ncbi:MAG: glycoside hydrolase family 3 C-terminal domain-containing protein [Saccharofermentans sp.]|nr:glycoside hydrolase family 3 C-terminal domain-containing protein [Saccharofermentans sp.]